MGGTPERSRSRSTTFGSPVRSLRSRRAVAKTRADRVATAPRKPVSLSEILRKDEHCRDPGRVSVVQHCLTSIGKVPDRFAAATSVYLSKNSLSTLAGIEQFSDLRVLSLSNNLIADLDELRALQPCSHLRVLNLQENPVAWLPYYRWHALQMLPSLRTIDGFEISDAERTMLPTIISRETATLRVMVQNECHLHQLRECLSRLQLHRSFHKTVHGRVGNLNGAANGVDDADPRRVLQMLSVQLSAEEQHAYMTRLREWVKSLWLARASGVAPLVLSRPGKESAAGAAPAQSKRVLTQANSPSSATTAQQIADYDLSLRDSSITKATLRNEQGVREAGISKLTLARKPSPIASDKSRRSPNDSAPPAPAHMIPLSHGLVREFGCSSAPCFSLQVYRGPATRTDEDGCERPCRATFLASAQLTVVASTLWWPSYGHEPPTQASYACAHLSAASYVRNSPFANPLGCCCAAETAPETRCSRNAPPSS